MVTLYFTEDGEPAKTQHVRARSWDNLRQYLLTVYKTGEDVGYDREAMCDRFQSFAGESHTAAEETHSLLKKFGFLNDNNELTVEGEFVGMAISKNRLDIVTEVFTQHFRAMPTLAYTIDIVRSIKRPLSASKIDELMSRYNTSDSSQQANSIQNALNLLEALGVIKFNQEGNAQSHLRKQTAIEAATYGLYLLLQEENPLQADTIRSKLPRLTHLTQDGCERLVSAARQDFGLLNFRTTGDPKRASPFGGVFEVYRNDDIMSYQLQNDLL